MGLLLNLLQPIVTTFDQVSTLFTLVPDCPKWVGSGATTQKTLRLIGSAGLGAFTKPATEREEIGGGNHQAQFSCAMSVTGGVSPPLEETEVEASIDRLSGHFSPG
jgi:hypothetical protein